MNITLNSKDRCLRQKWRFVLDWDKQKMEKQLFVLIMKVVTDFTTKKQPNKSNLYLLTVSIDFLSLT